MATVKGVWVFNETLTIATFEQEVKFTANTNNRTIAGTKINFFESNGIMRFYEGSTGFQVYFDSRWRNNTDRTVDFGTEPQTVSYEFYTWLTANAVQQGSEPETDTLYTVNGYSLTAVANAIRGKTGTTGELAFPDGYVSAVNDISSVSDLSNAKDIAFGGNESGGKYVIEDETITPLFDQIQRITETEEALTFEGAEQALLNVVPGGGLPVAEEWSFGRDSGAEYGITIKDTSKVTYYMLSGDYPCIVNYKAKEAFSLLGVRIYERRPSGGNEGRNVKVSINDELKTTVNIAYGEGVNGWNTLYFDQPFTVAVGDVINLYEQYESYPAHISTAYVKFNGKIEYAGGSYDSAIRGIFDVIIGSVGTDVPDEYQITRTTMDSIAVEVQRISGTTQKMNPAQIIAALQGM